VSGSVFRHAGDIRPGGIVCVADHASNHVPAGIDLGIEPALMQDHIALDIGVEGVADRLARRHGIPAHIACVSRLVCDFNRDEKDPAVVPEESDGHLIPATSAPISSAGWQLIIDPTTKASPPSSPWRGRG
jgi:predicted N-formylglutamate amidohydrolase